MMLACLLRDHTILSSFCMDCGLVVHLGFQSQALLRFGYLNCTIYLSIIFSGLHLHNGMCTSTSLKTTSFAVVLKHKKYKWEIICPLDFKSDSNNPDPKLRSILSAIQSIGTICLIWRKDILKLWVAEDSSWVSANTNAEVRLCCVV